MDRESLILDSPDNEFHILGPLPLDHHNYAQNISYYPVTKLKGYKIGHLNIRSLVKNINQKRIYLLTKG